MPSVTLSSAGTASILTDYIGARTTSVVVRFVSSTSSAAFSTPLQITLDASAVTGAAPVWTNLSSAAAGVFTSSANFDAVPLVQILSPVAGVRVTSSSTSGGIILTALQNSGG